MDVRITSLAALTLALASPVCSIAQQSPGYPTRSTNVSLSEKRYVAAGDRAYVVGVQDGTFQPIGWHIAGTMGGVWSHPIKLLESYSVSLGGSALPAAQQFTSGPGFVQLNFPTSEGAGMGAKKLDVAVYTIRALNDLAEMATSKGDSVTAKWATGLATRNEGWRLAVGEARRRR